MVPKQAKYGCSKNSIFWDIEYLFEASESLHSLLTSYWTSPQRHCNGIFADFLSWTNSYYFSLHNVTERLYISLRLKTSVCVNYCTATIWPITFLRQEKYGNIYSWILHLDTFFLLTHLLMLLFYSVLWLQLQPSLPICEYTAEHGNHS